MQNTQSDKVMFLLHKMMDMLEAQDVQIKAMQREIEALREEYLSIKERIEGNCSDKIVNKLQDSSYYTSPSTENIITHSQYIQKNEPEVIETKPYPSFESMVIRTTRTEQSKASWIANVLDNDLINHSMRNNSI